MADDAADHPLTTVFTPPASCNRIFYGTYYSLAKPESSGGASGFTDAVTYSTSFVAAWGVTAAPTTSAADDTACFPPDFHGVRYYSPGLCPDSWTQAATASVTGGPDTTATCCPSGYSAAASRECVSSFTTPLVVLDATAASDKVTITPADGRLETVLARAVVVRYRDGDFRSSAGLSAGAKAGIGVAVALVVIAGALLGYWLLRRRRGGAGRSGDTQVFSPGPPTGASELYSVAEPREFPLQELPGSRAEAAAPRAGFSGQTSTAPAIHTTAEPSLITTTELEGRATSPSDLPEASSSRNQGLATPSMMSQAGQTASIVVSSSEPPARADLEAELSRVRAEMSRLQLEELSRREQEILAQLKHT